MKLLFILLICCAGITVQAQKKSPFPAKPEHPVMLAPVKIYPTANDSMVATMKKRLQFSNESSGVIHLSQDRMPCIIPNSHRTVHMPNAWTSGSIGLNLLNGRIPNGAKKKKEQNLQFN